MRAISRPRRFSDSGSEATWGRSSCAWISCHCASISSRRASRLTAPGLRPAPSPAPVWAPAGVASAEAQQLVAQRGDDRDEQDPPHDADQQVLPGQEAEDEDADDHEAHEERGAGARVGGGMAADVVEGQALVIDNIR